MLTIAAGIVLAILILLLVPAVLLLGAAAFLFGLLLILATFVAWGLWASWAIAGVDLGHYAMPAALTLGVVGLLAVRAKDRLSRR